MRAEQSNIIPKDEHGVIEHMNEIPSRSPFEDPPTASSLQKDAPQFTSQSPTACHVKNSSAGQCMSGSDSPVGVLREALQKYEDGYTDVTVEGLARLQLHAQEYATRAGPAPGGRLKRRRRLQTMLASQVCKAADVRKGPELCSRKDTETAPVAGTIVDNARLSSTAHHLLHESSLKKSTRQSEAQRILVCLLQKTWCLAILAFVQRHAHVPLLCT